MAEIETREESKALQAAIEQIATEYTNPIRAYERTLIWRAWCAGRDWARNEQARQDTSVGVTLRLLVCPHTPGCLTVGQCAGRSGE